MVKWDVGGVFRLSGGRGNRVKTVGVLGFFSTLISDVFCLLNGDAVVLGCVRQARSLSPPPPPTVAVYPKTVKGTKEMFKLLS